MANSSEYICLPSGLSLTEFKVFHTSFCTDFCCRKRGRRELYGDNVVVVANYCRVDLLLNCMVAVSRKVDDFCKTISYFIIYKLHTYNIHAYVRVQFQTKMTNFATSSHYFQFIMYTQGVYFKITTPLEKCQLDTFNDKIFLQDNIILHQLPTHPCVYRYLHIQFLTKMTD